MPRTMLRPLLILFLLQLLLSACASGDRYRYQAIRDQAEQAPGWAGSLASIADPDSDPGNEPVEAPPPPVTIEQAVNFAIGNNPDMTMAVARIRQAEAMIDHAEAAFWPALAFYTNYLRGDAPSGYFFSKLDQRDFSFNTDFNDPGAFQNFESGGTARWNLFRGGRDLLHHEMAKTGHKIEQLELASVRNALAASVIRSAYSLFTARDYATVAEQALRTTEAQLHNTRIKVRGGSALKSDRLSLEARLAEARAARIQAQNQEQMAQAALANLLGLDADTQIQLASAIWQPPELPNDYNSGLLVALATRPELRKVRHQIIASRMAVDLEQTGYLPNLDLQARLYYDSETMHYSSNLENWTVGLMFRWDLFTGFSTRSKTRQAQAALNRMLAADRKTTQAIELDVKQAYLTLSEAQARLQAARAGSDQAAEALRLVRKEYEGGSATIVRYLEAELARHRSQIAEIRARYDLRQARANLARALGYFAGQVPVTAGGTDQPPPLEAEPTELQPLKGPTP